MSGRIGEGAVGVRMEDWGSMEEGKGWRKVRLGCGREEGGEEEDE